MFSNSDSPGSRKLVCAALADGAWIRVQAPKEFDRLESRLRSVGSDSLAQQLARKLHDFDHPLYCSDSKQYIDIRQLEAIRVSLYRQTWEHDNAKVGWDLLVQAGTKP